MKKKFLWSLIALPILASCAADEPLSGSGNESSEILDPVFVTVSINPNGTTGTRAETTVDGNSSDGKEVGFKYENDINKVFLILAEPTSHKYISSALIEKEKLTGFNVADQVSYQATAKFSKSVIAEYYDGTTNRDIDVFVVCNAPESLTNHFKTLAQEDVAWVDQICSVPDKVNPLDATEKINNILWNDSENKGFVMSNVSRATRTLPATMDDWTTFAVESNPFDLSGVNNAGHANEVDNSNLKNRGSIDVQRAAARFDFADGSQFNDVENGNGVKGTPFTYAVVENTDKKTIVNVELIRMGLVNVHKDEYYFKRVSADGLNTNNTLLGLEKPWIGANAGTYVVSPNTSERIDLSAKTQSNYPKYFHNSLFDAAGDLRSVGEGWGNFDLLSDVVKAGNEDNLNKNYYKWRYCTENAIPAEDRIGNMSNGISTGVVFKGKMLPTDELKNSTDHWEKTLYNALSGTTDISKADAPVLYANGGSIYVTWENVQAAALAAAGYNEQKSDAENSAALDRTASLYVQCFGNGGAGTVTLYLADGTTKTFTDNVAVDANSANSKWIAWCAVRGQENAAETSAYEAYQSAVTGANFSIYQASYDNSKGWGYYSYYYYWNRHNDNHKPGEMGRMEFGVVRNNVYKLAVTRLKSLGHPRVPGNDPDSPTPDTPDEKSDLYLTVSVKVVPWQVRVNNIEF